MATEPLSSLRNRCVRSTAFQAAFSRSHALRGERLLGRSASRSHTYQGLAAILLASLATQSVRVRSPRRAWERGGEEHHAHCANHRLARWVRECQFTQSRQSAIVGRQSSRTALSGVPLPRTTRYNKRRKERFI